MLAHDYCFEADLQKQLTRSFNMCLSAQWLPGSVVRCVSHHVQQQHPVLTSLLHPASVQSASSSAHPLLLSARLQQQLQDDGSLWLDTRDGAGAGGRGAAAARSYGAEERPAGSGVWPDEKSQSYALPSPGSRCRKTTIHV